MTQENLKNSLGNGKLSKEDLLAGKCFPGQGLEERDPRLKSPDDLLLKLAKMKQKIEPQNEVVFTTVTPIPEPVAPQKNPISEIQNNLQQETLSDIGLIISSDPMFQKNSEPIKIKEYLAPSQQEDGESLLKSGKIEIVNSRVNSLPETFQSEASLAPDPILDQESMAFQKPTMIELKPIETEIEIEPKIEKIDLVIPEKSPYDLMRDYATHQSRGEQGKKSDELNALKIKHEQEIKKWLEYNDNINIWKEQVMASIAKVKKDLAEVEKLKDENKNLKDELKMKEEELTHLQTMMTKPNKMDFLLKLLGNKANA